jgi:rubredoxin
MPEYWKCQNYHCGTHFNDLPDGGVCPVCKSGGLDSVKIGDTKWTCQNYHCGTTFNNLPDDGLCPTCLGGGLEPTSK